ncbi:MAG: hypothetical protein OEW80_10470, partial [Gemmatimonadota bacterium]|nr:hypothetical protein [Gemmatimonadota bacterium]
HKPRLSFAGRLAPVLELTSGRFEVVDLSSDGLRFRGATSTAVPTIGAVLRGVIRFPADRAVEVEGRVLRVAGGETALQLAVGREEIATAAPAGPGRARRFGLLW